MWWFALEWRGMKRGCMGKGGGEGMQEFCMMIAWIKGQGERRR